MRMLRWWAVIAAAGIVSGHAGVAAGDVADTAHLYRFEDSPGFLRDHAQTADLAGGAIQVALPATGRGGDFIKWGGGNTEAADLVGGRLWAAITPITSQLTVELFAHLDSVAAAGRE